VTFDEEAALKKSRRCQLEEMYVLTACLAQRSTHYHEDYSMSETEMVLLGVLYTST
jgi:hypothetical protein